MMLHRAAAGACEMRWHAAPALSVVADRYSERCERLLRVYARR